MTITKVYKQYGQKYPYAAAIVAYAMGNKEDNTIQDAIKGVYGRHTQVCEVEVAELWFSYETRWESEIDELEYEVMQLRTKDGVPLAFYY